MHVSPRTLVFAGLAVLALLTLFSGLRWQLIPSYLAFGLLALGAMKRTPPKLRWRILAAIPVSVLFISSVTLSGLFPVFTLPEPTGPYSVGTFDYSMIDESRAERFKPQTNRELPMRVWYPSTNSSIELQPVRTLWQDLYTGDSDLISFFSSHLALIETHSHIESPIAVGEKSPILIFNHGFMSPSEQNTVLMEHLASHGYVVISIAHTFQSTKVFLSSSEKVLFTTDMPADLNIDEGGVGPRTGVKVESLFENGIDYSLADEQLFSLFDRYQNTASEEGKRRLTEEAIRDRDKYLIGPDATADTLYNYFYGPMTAMGSFVQTWTEDIKFVVDHLQDINAPIAGFTDALDSERLGVFGHSLGSSAAGEFCKLDDRCRAGIHIDGNQQGLNWNAPLLAPFLVMYSSNFYLGNEFAYKNSNHDFWNMTIENIDHLDFTDLGLAVRGITLPGMMGDVDNQKVLTIINQVSLSFFDHYLKGAPLRSDLTQLYSELTLEQREK